MLVQEGCPIFEQMLNRALITLLLLCVSQIQTFAQVLGVPLYSWDFSGGLPTTWTNGSTSNIGVWEYRGPSTVPSNAITSRGSCAGGSSAFNSVTQSNGFMIFDSNYWDDNDNQCGGFGTGPDPGPHTAWLISNSFSLTGVTGAVVTYQQQFRNYSSTIKVQYSINNGTTWIDMLTQSDFPGATAEWKSATFPAGAIGQTNVRLRFLYSGSYYHWAIDDITVFKPSINNLSINNTRYTTFGNTTPVPPNDFHDLPYDRYPKTMIVPFKFSGKATNIGSASQTNSNLNVKVLNAANTALYNQTSANATVTAGNTATYTLTTGFTPTTTTGYFRIAYQVNQTQTDESPNNNKDTLDYYITDYQYARDEGPMEDAFTPSALYAGQTHQVGNIFEGRSNTVKCTSIAVAVGPGTAIGTTIQASIYKNDFTNLQATSVVYPVNEWDINAIGQQRLITLQLPTPLTLYADSVYIVMVGNTVGSQALKVCRSGAAIDQTSFVRYPQNNGLFFMAKMPVVRMNLFTLTQTPGCTNPLANNYSPSALIDDGSCDIPGCIYLASSNYNPNANWYDGSCVVSGCTIPTACNYSSIATVNDGSCIMPLTYYADADADGFGNSAVSQFSCTVPAGYVTNSTDCNDSNANVRPTAIEICNTIDDNCNGQINEGISFITYYADSDGDGFGNPSVSQNSCITLVGYVANNTDCNDANSLVKPTAIEICNTIDDNCNGLINEGLVFLNYYLDSDLDGYGAGTAQSSCTPLGSTFVTNNLDCNNLNANIRPNAIEICNGLDDNCNDLIDDGLIFQSYYLDTDSDGFGAGVAVNACSNPGSGYVTNNTDCNNTNPAIRPGATEICNAIDDNCNISIDEGLTFVNYYIDTDSDGFGAGTATNSCSNPGSGYVTNNTDCNNTNAAIRPGATELCNAIDDNCNSLIDDGLTFVNYYIDTDSDGFGAGTVINACSIPGLGYVTNNTDCNNTNAAIRPGATEICNAIDDNCNISIDEGLIFVNYYIDTDSDGFGAGTATNSCSNPGAGFVTNNTDCNNNNPNIRPNAIEICNSTDDNCNNAIDEGLIFVNYYIDTDADGFGAGTATNTCSNPGTGFVTNNTDCIDSNTAINPAASEICNVLDDNCNGLVNEGLVFLMYYLDADNDGYYLTSLSACSSQGINYTTNAGVLGDCNDANPAINAGAIEICGNGIDEDCNGIDPICIIPGCTNPIASNFNPLANLENGSCIIYGCLDANADNYNPLANTSNQGCIYYGCIDPFANNFDPSANTDDFSCAYNTAAIDISANHLCVSDTLLAYNQTQYSSLDSCIIDFGDGTTLNYCAPIYTHVYSDAGIYSVELTIIQGSQVSSALSTPILVNNTPVVGAINLNFPNLLISTDSNYSIQWFFNQVPTEFTEQSIDGTVNYSDDGFYYAQITNEFGCTTKTDSIYFVIPTYQSTQLSQCGPTDVIFQNTTISGQNLDCHFENANNSAITFPSPFTYSMGSPEVTSFVQVCNAFGNNYYSLNNPIYETYAIPATPNLNYSSYVVQVDNSSGNNIQWFLNGTPLNVSSSAQSISTYFNNNFQNGNYAAVYTNEFGCTSDTGYYFVMEVNATATVTSGCYPLTTTITNNTSMSAGIQCEILLPGQGYTSIDASIDFTFNNPGIYQPTLYCHSGIYSNTYILDPITVFSHPITPVITSSYGQVNAANNILGYNVAWSLDGNFLNASTNSISTLINGIFENGYYAVTYTDANGCNTASEPFLVIQPNYSVLVGEGCSPLSAVLSNTTDPVNGMTCTITDGLGGATIPIDATAQITFNDSGNFAPEMTCSVGDIFGSYSDTVITVFSNPIAPALSSTYGQVNVSNNTSGLSVAWSLDGNNLNLSGNSISTFINGILENGYYSATYTDANGCATTSQPFLVIQPNYSVEVGEGCAPLVAVLTNTTDPVNGMTCNLADGIGGTSIPFNSIAQLNYNDAGSYAPEMTCSVGTISGSFSDPVITVFSHPVEPILSSTYGQVNVNNNTSGFSVAWGLDGSNLNLSGNSISTLINGILENGYYSATYTDGNGCATTSSPLLVIQPNYSVVTGEGCGPLQAVLSNTTDPVNGMTCSLADGIGGASIPFNSTAQLNYSDAGSYAPEISCSVGNISGTFNNSVITVFPNPTPIPLSYNAGFIEAANLPATQTIVWTLNGSDLNDTNNPLSIQLGNLSGYFYGTITNEYGCTVLTDTLLQIFPSFTLSSNSGCGPLSIQATNTTSTFNGMSCVLQTNGTDYPLNVSNTLNYSVDGDFTTSIACTLGGAIFTANGPNVTIYPNPPTPQLSSAYGAVLCSNCAGLSTQYFLDNIAFAQGSNVISTQQNGNYQNGYYTAQSSSYQGCLSQVSQPILLIQPVLNFTPSEGCAPLQASFINTTDYITGLSCELFLGNGNGNIPLSYLETYNFNYTSANTYSPYLTCTLNNSIANSPTTSLTVNGGTSPQLIFENGFATCTNCANQDNVTWIIDGTLTIDSLISVSDTLGQFFSCDYINEFGCTSNSFLASTFEEINVSFNLYPNPTADILNISGLQPSSTLEIRDTQGRIVYRESGTGKFRIINTAYFSNGMYTITETSKKSTRSGTLLVNH